MKAQKFNIETSEIKVSLTTFADFVLSVGMDRLKAASKVLDQQTSRYSPSNDFYKRFREAFVKHHDSGLSVTQLLPDVIKKAGLPKHQINYEHLVKGYLKFWAVHFQEQEVSSAARMRSNWSTGHLCVTVNPELHFLAGGVRYWIKMYLKAPPPSVAQVDIVLHLMQRVLWAPDVRPVVALLDVRRGRLFEATNYDRRYEPLLRGEALSLVGMCQSIHRQRIDDLVSRESFHA